ncbi:MAG: hypothetical protein AB8B55_09075 [Mariniblastus sp.]
MPWGKRQKLANRAMIEGDLDSAVEHLKRDKYLQTYAGRRVSRRLVESLIERANAAIAVGNFSPAWKDLTTASEIATPKDHDLISRQKNQLVELTIESSEALLSAGKVTHAVQQVRQLTDRQIMDWRSDRIHNVAKCLHQADEFSATGKLDEAISQLEQARNIQPDLPFIESRLAAGRQRQIQMKELTEELQATALKCQWADVSKCCQKILMIAPKHQIALDAQRHCITRAQRKTSAGLRATQIPEPTNRVSKSNSFFQFGDKDPSVHSTSDQGTSGLGTSGLEKSGLGASELARHDSAPATELATVGTFVLWVDGVGGYLVCTSEVNTVGQAVPHCNVAIPIQGDLRRRHVRLETVGGQHLIHPLGDVSVDGETLESPAEIKNKQTIGLDGGVRLKYTQTHPLSKTARLDFVSRHRTHPWSDAVLLATQSIILGPNRDNHVFCPTWRFDLIIFQRKGKWFCRTKEPFEIDGETVDKEGEIQINSRIVGEDFSVTLEPFT